MKVINSLFLFAPCLSALVISCCEYFLISVKLRLSGDGIVRKREDGRWEGRFVIGHKENGEPIFRYIYADTQKELTAKL